MSNENTGAPFIDMEARELAAHFEAFAAPPQAFRDAATELAGWLGLDAQALIAGHPFHIDDTVVILKHYGGMDPQAATVIVDQGQVPPDEELDILRQLLAHNLQTPAGLHGYFGYVPQSRRIQFCTRVELAHADSAADALGRVVAMSVHARQVMSDVLRRHATAA